MQIYNFPSANVFIAFIRYIAFIQLVICIFILLFNSCQLAQEENSSIFFSSLSHYSIIFISTWAIWALLVVIADFLEAFLINAIELQLIHKILVSNEIQPNYTDTANKKEPRKLIIPAPNNNDILNQKKFVIPTSDSLTKLYTTQKSTNTYNFHSSTSK